MYVTRRLLHTRHYSGKDKTKVQKKQVILLTANRIDNYCYKVMNMTVIHILVQAITASVISLNAPQRSLNILKRHFYDLI